MVKYYYQKGKPVGIIWEESGSEKDSSLILAAIGGVATTIVILGLYYMKSHR